MREVLTGRMPSTATPPGQDPIPAPGTVPQGLVDNAVLLVSELVTNAVVYAGTDIDVVCRLERHPNAAVAVVVEVADRHPSRGVRGAADARHGEPGYGLQLVSALSQAWGVTYRRSEKRVWFRLESSSVEPGPSKEATPPRTGETGAPGTVQAAPGDVRPPEEQERSHRYAAEWVDRSGPSFLAETSELLAGQLDQGMVAAL
ncbi:ATP-binding protein, partial [Streptomyces sp. NPDC055144]